MAESKITSKVGGCHTSSSSSTSSRNKTEKEDLTISNNDDTTNLSSNGLDDQKKALEDNQHDSPVNSSSAGAEYLSDSSTGGSCCCSSASSSCSSSPSSLHSECRQKLQKSPEATAETEEKVPSLSSKESPPQTIWVLTPDAKWKVRNLGLLAAILPGIGCYFCLAYTFIFQFDKVSNFTIPSSFCPGLKSMFPPLSYSIGVWKPQKYIWMMILSLHMPPRFFYAIVHKNHYSLGDSEFRTRRWFAKIERLHYVLLLTEAFGLLAVSIIDIESNFKIHAFCFAVWLTSFDFNMLFNNILHYHSGICALKPMHMRVFRIKCALFLVGYPLSVSTGISYLIFILFCNTTAYAVFSLAEYFLVGFNSLFYFVLIWEFDGSKVEVYIKHQCHHKHNKPPHNKNCQPITSAGDGQNAINDVQI